MKIISSVLYQLLVCSALISSQACLAEESNTTLEVTGTLTPGACTAQLANGGIVDYGTTYSMGLINSSNQLGVKNLDLTIHCDSPTGVAIVATDNRVDSQASVSVEHSWNSNETVTTSSKKRFSLGMTSANKPIGAFTIGIDLENVLIDDHPNSDITMLYTSDVNAQTLSWRVSGSGAVWEHSYNGYWYGMTPGYSTGYQPVPFTNATIPLIISAAVVKNSELGTKDEINLDGNVTLSMVYI